MYACGNCGETWYEKPYDMQCRSCSVPLTVCVREWDIDAECYDRLYAVEELRSDLNSFRYYSNKLPEVDEHQIDLALSLLQSWGRCALVLGYEWAHGNALTQRALETVAGNTAVFSEALASLNLSKWLREAQDLIQGRAFPPDMPEYIDEYARQLVIRLLHVGLAVCAAGWAEVKIPAKIRRIHNRIDLNDLERCHECLAENLTEFSAATAWAARLKRMFKKVWEPTLGSGYVSDARKDAQSKFADLTNAARAVFLLGSLGSNSDC